MIEHIDPLGIVTMPEAAAILEITPGAATKAAVRGRLAARCIGAGQRAVWITTRADVLAYAVERHPRGAPAGPPDALAICNACDAAPALPESAAGYCADCEATALEQP